MSMQVELGFEDIVLLVIEGVAEECLEGEGECESGCVESRQHGLYYKGDKIKVIAIRRSPNLLLFVLSIEKDQRFALSIFLLPPAFSLPFAHLLDVFGQGSVGVGLSPFLYSSRVHFGIFALYH
jgi:hypothetical protein